MHWPVYWGQNYLSEIATETGAQAYFLGFETPVSFAPYLEDLSRRLNHQYLLAFLAKPEKKPGLQSVRVRTEVPNVELVAATKVFVLVPALSRAPAGITVMLAIPPRFSATRPMRR